MLFTPVKPMLLHMGNNNEIVDSDEWIYETLSRVFLNKYCFISILTLFIYKL